MWIFAAVASAILLGIYDITKKVSLNNNAVIPILFFSSLTSAVIFSSLLLISGFGGFRINGLPLIPTVNTYTHFLIFLKSIIVGSSWLFSYFALKHLPITIVTPIRSTGPVWTITGALLIFAERPNNLQWIGIAITLVFFLLFSLTGKKEGIKFIRNKFIYLIIAATLTGAVSGLYDKYLIKNIDRLAVQAWFSVYMALIYLPVLLLLWFPKRKNTTPFQWRWSIVLIGLFLSFADFLYFYALSFDDALISIISLTRRGSVIISFMFGAIMLKEKNIIFKAIMLLGILTGLLVIVFATK